MTQPFSGSYSPDDCIFLLRPIPMPEDNPVDPSVREHLIQSGKRHYSETIPREQPPSQDYMALFARLKAIHIQRFAGEIRFLGARLFARQVANRIAGEDPRSERAGGHVEGHEGDEKPVLLSLARAGTPIGVLLKRALKTFHNMDAHHYSLSIIRDRGLDQAALKHILIDRGHNPANVIFVDGWTAKGTITRELKSAVAQWNAANPTYALSGELWVVSDPGGQADMAATRDDYVIPSGILNAVISGLVSRSSMVDVQPDGFHTCVLYEHLRHLDISTAFIDEVVAAMSSAPPNLPALEPAAQRREAVRVFLVRIAKEHGVSDINRIKPGIAEATRALLRRVPGMLLLRDRGHRDVAHLVMLAEQKGVPIVEDAAMPFNAATLIKDVVRT